MSWGVRGVTVRLGGTDVLRDVSVDVPAGTITSLVGGDGAGKTTLLRCLVGQVEPVVGTVDRPPKEAVGYMAAASGTWRELTVGENLAFVGGAYGMARDDLAERSAALLDRAGLNDARHRLAGDLSGGMRQKLGFVLAVLHRPDLLVLDEPSTGVDPVSRVELWRMIAEAAANGTAVVMATSYLDEAERTNVLHVLDEGRILLSGAADDLVDQMPGTVRAVDAATGTAEGSAGDLVSDPERAWRRGATIHEWMPDGHAADARTHSAGAGGAAIEHPDVEDIAIACMLAARAGRTARA